MDLPNHQPNDPNVQRVEVKIADDKYLTVHVGPDEKHGQKIDLTLFQRQDEAVGGLDMLAFVEVYADGEVFVVVDKELNEALG